jgi:SAM-dependent methyltransferase
MGRLSGGSLALCLGGVRSNIPIIQKIADTSDLWDSALDLVLQHAIMARRRIYPRQWEFAMAFEALRRTGMLRPDARGISFGSGREPLIFPVAEATAHLTVTDLYSSDTSWDVARTSDPKAFVLAAAPRGFDPARISVAGMDMREVAHPDESFDYAYSISAFEHIGMDEDFIRHLREVARVLKPGGTYVLTTEFRLGPTSRRMQGNHSFEVQHILSLFREAGLCPAPVLDARLTDRLENEPRVLAQAMHHDPSNLTQELLMVREYGGIISVPCCWVLTRGPWRDPQILGLEETVARANRQLDLRSQRRFGEWVRVNPFHPFPSGTSPFFDAAGTAGAGREQGGMLFCTDFHHVGSGTLAVRVTLGRSRRQKREGAIAIGVNSWSRNDVGDLKPAHAVRVALPAAGDRLHEAEFEIPVSGERGYAVFARHAAGDVMLSHVDIAMRRLPA